MTDPSDDNDEDDGTSYQDDKFQDTRVRQMFMRASYDVESAKDRNAYAEDMTWVRGRRKYWTARRAKVNTVWVWVVATVVTALISQSMPSQPFVTLFHWLEALRGG